MTVFDDLYPKTVLPVVFKLVVTSSIKLPLVKNLRSFINKTAVTFDDVAMTISNTLLI